MAGKNRKSKIRNKKKKKVKAKRFKLRPRRRSRSRKKPRIKKIKKTNELGGRAYYGFNPKFEFSEELKNLMLTPPPASLSKMARKISALGRVKLALVSGVFLNKENVADILIVADDVDRRKFKNFLKSLEAEIGTQIIFAIMDKEEFNYRRAMFDRFVRLMLEGPHEILIDKIGL